MTQPTPYVGQLLAAGLGKESVLGTVVSPSEYLGIIPPDSFFPGIELLEVKGVRSLPDKVYKIVLGAGDVKGLKLKWEAEPENIGNLLMGAFGTDTLAESASFVINSSNAKIDFKISGGSQLHATIASATYAMGSSSSVAGSLCAAVKTALDAAGGGTTFTVAFNSGTKKITITPSSGTIQILWLTGTNQANAAYAILGFTHVDTADASTNVSDSTTAAQVWLHTFTRIASATLPTYTWWFNKGPKYMQFPGSMVSKLDITAKAKDMIYMDSEWVALNYDDNGSSKSPSYSAAKPFKFDQLVVNIDGSQVTGYDNVKVSIGNNVKADHIFNNSIYPGVIYSEGLDVMVMLDFIASDATQLNKFLAGTDVAINLVLTAADDISGGYAGNKYTLTLDLPSCNYSVASIPIANGLQKIAFTAKARYNTGSTKTMSAALRNSVSSSY